MVPGVPRSALSEWILHTAGPLPQREQRFTSSCCLATVSVNSGNNPPLTSPRAVAVSPGVRPYSADWGRTSLQEPIHVPMRRPASTPLRSSCRCTCGTPGVHLPLVPRRGLRGVRRADGASGGRGRGWGGLPQCREKASGGMIGRERRLGCEDRGCDRQGVVRRKGSGGHWRRDGAVQSPQSVEKVVADRLAAQELENWR